MVVQRKWMYLESIFLAGDIRAQLPEEAKKFDVIDKTFKKVTAPITASLHCATLFWLHRQCNCVPWLRENGCCAPAHVHVYMHICTCVQLYTNYR